VSAPRRRKPTLADGLAEGAKAAGPYGSLAALRFHLNAAHAGMSDRELSFLLDGARRQAVRAAMNGNGRPH
jgi:hypothetical protein